MRRKILIAITTLIIILLFTPSFVYAETVDSSTTSSAPNFRAKLSITPGQKKAELQATRIEKLKEKANKEIDRRIDSLNKLLSKVETIKRLSDTQKASLKDQIQEQITSLTNLKTKIAADSDIETLKTDVQSIIKAYRIYLLFIPKIHILAGADVMLDASDKATTISAKLQTKITDAKTAGSDVATLEATLTDMQAKIADAKKQAQTAIDTVTPLTPEGYPDNKTTLQSARTMLKTGRQDLHEARIDAKKIMVGLKDLKINASSNTATSSSN